MFGNVLPDENLILTNTNDGLTNSLTEKEKEYNPLILHKSNSKNGQLFVLNYNPLFKGTDLVYAFNTIMLTFTKELFINSTISLNTLNGDSNLAFFQQLSNSGITSDDIPVMSFSSSEQEVQEIGADILEGHLTAWNYYQTIVNNKNAEFVERYKEMFGADKVSGDPIASAHTAVHLWAEACNKAGSFDVEAVRIAAKGMSYDSPLGLVTIDGSNQHLYKPVLIGRINSEGLIDEIWRTPDPVKPDPYLSSYYWAWGLK